MPNAFQRLRRAAMAAIILLLAPINFAAAQSKITIGVPPVPEFVLPMVAVENGYFREHRFPDPGYR